MEELLAEAKYYLVQGLLEECQAALQVGIILSSYSCLLASLFSLCGIGLIEFCCTGTSSLLVLAHCRPTVLDTHVDEYTVNRRTGRPGPLF